MPRWKRWLRRAALLLLLLVLLVPLAGWILPRFAGGALAREIRAATGLRATVGTVSGNLLWGLTIDRLRLEGEGPSPMVRRVEVERASVDYSAFGWVTGADGWLGPVTVENAAAVLDLDGTAPAPAAVGPDAGSERGSEIGLADVPPFRLTGGRVTVHAGGRRLELAGIDADHAAGAGELRIAGGTLFTDGRTDAIPPLAAALRRDGERVQAAEIRVDGRPAPEDHVTVDLAGPFGVDVRLSVAGGTLVAKGTYGDRRVSGRVALERLPAAPLLRAAGATLSVDGGVVSLDVTLRGDPRDLRSIIANGSVTAEAARVRDLHDMLVKGVVRVKAGRAIVDALTVQSREGTVTGSGAAELDGTVRLDVSGVVHAPRAVVPDIDEALAAVGPVAGPIRVRLRVDGPVAAPKARLTVGGDLRGKTLVGKIDVDVNADLNAGPNAGPSGAGTANGAAVTGRVMVVLSRVDLTRYGVPLLTDGAVEAQFTPGRLTITRAVARVGPGTVEARGVIGLDGFRPDTIDGSVRLQKISLTPLARWLGPGLDGVATARVDVGGRMAAPEITARVDLADLAYEDLPPSTVAIDAAYTEGRARLERVTVRGEAIDVSARAALPMALAFWPASFRLGAPVEGSAALDAKLGAASRLHRELPELGAIHAAATLEKGVVSLRRLESTFGPESRLRASGSIRLEGFRPASVDLKVKADDVDLAVAQRLVGEPIAGRAEGQVEIRGDPADPEVELRLTVEDARFRGPRLARLAVTAATREANVRVESLRLETATGVFTATGVIPADVGVFPPSWKLDRSRPVSAALRSDRVDVGPLLDKVGPIRKVEGPLTLDLTVGGTLDRPAVSGEVVLEGSSVRLKDASVPRIDAITGRIAIERNRVRIAKLSAQLGREPVEITGVAEYAIEGTTIRLGRCEASARGERVLVYSSADVRIRSDVDLEFVGNGEGGKISGSAAPRGSRYLRDIPLSGGGSGPATVRISVPRFESAFARALVLDVALRPGNGILVDTNVARLRAVPNLRIGGTAAAPTIVGKIAFERGKLFTPTQTFDLELGEIEFLERDPWRPYVNLAAETRITGIEVRVLVTGPLDQHRIELTSNPSLPREDIAALIAVGALRSEMTKQDLLVAAGTSGAKYLLEHFFPRERGAEPGFFGQLIDRLQFETVPARTPQDSSKQVRAWIRVLDYLYLRGEKDRYGDHNLDVLLRFRFGGASAPAKGDTPR